MTTTARTTTHASPTTDPRVDTPRRALGHRADHRRIPFGRVLAVELRKTFDTRSGAWLLASIVLAALVATAAVILVAPDSALTYATFASAIGFPVAIILPIVALLSVTSEWSQRTGLTTFTSVPHRGRVVAAKAVVSAGIGVVSMLVAAAIGALGTVLGSLVTGTDAVWDLGVVDLALIVLANVLGLLVGFMLGVLLRSSAAAIVAYFVFAFVLPTLAMVLAASQAWFRDLQPWIDFTYTQTSLYEGLPSPVEWAHLGVASLLWLVLPLAVGVRLVLRSEVK